MEIVKKAAPLASHTFLACNDTVARRDIYYLLLNYFFRTVPDMI